MQCCICERTFLLPESKSPKKTVAGCSVAFANGPSSPCTPIGAKSARTRELRVTCIFALVLTVSHQAGKRAVRVAGLRRRSGRGHEPCGQCAGPAAAAARRGRGADSAEKDAGRDGEDAAGGGGGQVAPGRQARARGQPGAAVRGARGGHPQAGEGGGAAAAVARGPARRAAGAGRAAREKGGAGGAAVWVAARVSDNAKLASCRQF